MLLTLYFTQREEAHQPCLLMLALIVRCNICSCYSATQLISSSCTLSAKGGGSSQRWLCFSGGVQSHEVEPHWNNASFFHCTAEQGNAIYLDEVLESLSPAALRLTAHSNCFCLYSFVLPPAILKTYANQIAIEEEHH